MKTPGQMPGQTPVQTADRVLGGLGVADGVAVGPAWVVDGGLDQVAEYRVPVRRRKAELARLMAAVAEAEAQLADLRRHVESMTGAAEEELGYLLDAHAQMLSGSRLIRGVCARVERDGTNAEAAVQQEIGAVMRQFRAMPDPYLAARADDVRDVGQRLIRNLGGGGNAEPFAEVPKGAIVIARDITPADAASMDPARVGGVAAELGGADSHTAIMARGLGLPAVLGVGGLLADVRHGDMVVVDGAAGQVIVRPDAATVAAYRKARAQLLRRRRALGRLRHLPAETRDGVAVNLLANIELPAESDQARTMGAEGIGLVRSEFLFLSVDSEPDEDTQYAALAQIVTAMQGRPVTIRTLDLGSDKLPAAMTGGVAAGENPALGLRGIRLGLQQTAQLETQLAAILRAAALGPVRILLPMVTTVAEISAARQAMLRAARRLRRQGVDIPDELPPLGAMIEVPAAALSADSLARACDFFSIGSNDLTMYTLALDRTNEQVAELYDPLHPGVLRLIQFAVAAAHRAGIPVNMCGEMAGDPRFAPLLIGLGIRDLSMAAGSIPLVKQRIRRLDSVRASETADSIMALGDPVRAAQVLDRLDLSVD